MTVYQFKLSTTAVANQVELIRVRQDDDESQIFRATIFEDGKVKNLNGVSAEFNMVDAQHYIVVDDARIVDATNGIVEYQLRKEAMLSVGRCNAYFSFKSNKEVVYSTKDFNYNVIWSALSSPMHQGCDYVWTASDLIDSLKDWIEHAMGDFDDWFESVKEILASIDPGGVILNELFASRKSEPFGIEHKTLQARVNFTDAVLKPLDDAEHSLDIEKFEPMFVGNLATFRNAVLQAFNIDSATSQYYASQSNSQTPEGFVISHISPNGSKLLSKMEVQNGGHGTNFGIERENDRVYIWTIIRTNTGIQKLIRVPYKENSVLTYDSSLKDYTPETLNNIYFTPVVDMVNGYMLIRRGDGLCELRDLSDIKSGVDKVLYKTQIPKNENNDERPMQGAVSHNTTLYWYSGWSTNAIRVLKYDMKTGKLLATRDFDLPNETGSNFTDNYREPEGLAYYVNPFTGKESLLMGITSGGMQKRYNMIYAIHQRGAQEHFDSIRAISAQNYAITRGDGRAHSTPDGLKKLSDLRNPGEYYLTTTIVDSLSDIPSPQFSGSGMFVKNMAGEQHYNLRQIITRFSYSRKNFTMERSLNLDGSFGSWTVHNSQSNVVEYLAPEKYKNMLTNVGIAGEYYITTPSSTAFMDHPEKGVAGWWLKVSSGDLSGSFVQKLTRNSNDYIRSYQRIVTGASSGVWVKFQDAKTQTYVDIPLSGEAKSGDLRVANNGNQIIIRGKVDAPAEESVYATLPKGFRPNYAWETTVSVAGTTGVRKIAIRTDGTIYFSGIIANNVDKVTLLNMNLVVPIN
ncbi:BppU family phage baseplate upper protein [Brochothrix thermosphacta]|uniref:phage baseplate protein n=1 Tax=Brochothrix thermosphacta TaxID=2756 RepID=UPI00083FAC0F|nr:BppU family phage baseplate upper protein [Brochothrix thermosphacta]ODJ59866.1 hypothetical protein BFR44_02125 [Brochothrix thermosphacta]